jgi:hypothetical protein
MDCYKYCEDIQQQYIIINDKILEMERQNAADGGGRYSEKQLKRYSKLSTEFQKLLLDHQICVEGCKLRTQYSGDDSKDSTRVDPDILKELNALEEEEEEEYIGGDRTRSTIRRRNKSKTKRRQTHSTRRRNNRRRRSTRRNRKQ